MYLYFTCFPSVTLLVFVGSFLSLPVVQTTSLGAPVAGLPLTTDCVTPGNIRLSQETLSSLWTEADPRVKYLPRLEHQQSPGNTLLLRTALSPLNISHFPGTFVGPQDTRHLSGTPPISLKHLSAPWNISHLPETPLASCSISRLTVTLLVPCNTARPP